MLKTRQHLSAASLTSQQKCFNAAVINYGLLYSTTLIVLDNAFYHLQPSFPF